MALVSIILNDDDDKQLHRVEFDDKDQCLPDVLQLGAKLYLQDEHARGLVYVECSVVTLPHSAIKENLS